MNNKPTLYALFHTIYTGEDQSETSEQIVFTTTDENLIQTIKETLTNDITTNSFHIKPLYNNQFYDTEFILPELCLLPAPLGNEFIAKEIPIIIKSAVNSINIYREKHLSGKFFNIFDKYMTMSIMEFIENESGYTNLFSKYIKKEEFLKFFDNQYIISILKESEKKLI